MPVRKLDEFLRERNLIQVVPLSSLNGVRVGVDGNVWLKQAAPQEPFHVAIGGPPLSLEAALLASANQYRDAGLKPLFVFAGLAVPRKDGGRASFAADMRHQLRISGWEAYYKGDIRRAATDFAASEKNAAPNHLHQVMALLAAERFDYFRAPMLAWSQLAYFERCRLCHYVAGGSHLLLAGCERVVLDFDFNARVAHVVELRRVLDELGLQSFDHFLDMCVLAGFDYSTTFPPLLETPPFTFRAAVDMVKHFRSGLNAVQVLSAKSPPATARLQTESFLTARALVRHMLVLETNGTVAPLNRDGVPRDLHDVVGVRLPDEIYFLVSLGIINTQQLNNIMSGVLLEAPPLSDSDEYRNLLDQLADARAAALGIVIAELNEFYHQRPIVTARWYASNVDIVMNHAAPRLTLGNWHPRARGDLLAQSPNVSICDVARHLAAPPAGSADDTPPLLTAPGANATPAAMIAEAIGAPVLKLLVMRNYAVKGGATTAWGRALASVPSEFGDEAMLVLELLRMGLLNGDAFHHYPPETTPQFDNELQVRLLTRVFSVLACNLRAEAWEGPLDHDLLGFNSLVKALHRTLRNVLEAELAARVLRRELMGSVSSYGIVAHRMPFRQESNTALGIVLKHLLLQPNETVTSLAPTFANCVDIAADLRRGRAFWRAILAAVRALGKAGEVDAKVVQLFESAEQLQNGFSF